MPPHPALLRKFTVKRYSYATKTENLEEACRRIQRFCGKFTVKRYLFAAHSHSSRRLPRAGANALVGGSNNSFAPQPVSVEGRTGLGVAAGIAAFKLRALRR